LGPACFLAGTPQEYTLFYIAELLHALHLPNPAPITDPCPALRLPASTSTSTPAKARRGPHSSRSSHTTSQHQQRDSEQGPLQYQQSPVWTPDTYSLGPAPMLLAGVECMQSCMVWVPKVGGTLITDVQCTCLIMTACYRQLLVGAVCQSLTDHLASGLLFPQSVWPCVHWQAPVGWCKALSEPWCSPVGPLEHTSCPGCNQVDCFYDQACTCHGHGSAR
jgi:hypothetical protein